ncbi:hypothetical protein EVAR_24763_1 [Eumeta japonica]|uniref:Uncharacterized protein n=1 Tax=Eumeta variegata TaxID=151549 RepID=A0A4C1VDZ7_EUMVA|nr:hypothetical protein EVAR_24763_1 [Eumeta japonica]
MSRLGGAVRGLFAVSATRSTFEVQSAETSGGRRERERGSRLKCTSKVHLGERSAADTSWHRAARRPLRALCDINSWILNRFIRDPAKWSARHCRRAAGGGRGSRTVHPISVPTSRRNIKFSGSVSGRRRWRCGGLHKLMLFGRLCAAWDRKGCPRGAASTHKFFMKQPFPEDSTECRLKSGRDIASSGRRAAPYAAALASTPDLHPLAAPS